MTINHINLVVSNVASAATFFETYFQFERTVIKGDYIIVALQNSEKFTLVLSGDKNGEVAYPKDFHIGFMLETPEQVDDLYEKLKLDSFEIGQAPKKIRDSHAFYFYFDNLFIEVGHYFTPSTISLPDAPHGHDRQ